MKIFKNFPALFGLVVLASCAKDKSTANIQCQSIANEEFSIIPLESALVTLEDFLLDTYPDKLTKAGSFENLIASIDTHYSQSVLTKAGEPIEDAYIVNFVDDSGFAVLGANNKVGEIIAVTEEGFLLKEDIDTAYDTPEQEEILFYGDDGNGLTSFYCEEDDDYYSAGTFLLPVLIYNGINSNDENGIVGPTGSGSGGSGLNTVSPMLKTRWSQGEYHKSGVYNKYCKHCGNNVYSGCSTTALAQIIAHNQFPKIICGRQLEYEFMTSRTDAHLLDDDYKEQVSPLSCLATFSIMSLRFLAKKAR